jgi:signal transduction histidine kinase
MEPVARPERLLLVDDSETSLMFLSTILRGGGYEQLRMTRSGEEALRTLDVLHDDENGAPFDLVLMDINMPGMSGIEALKQLKQDERFHEIPVVMVTVSDEQQNLSEALDAGAMDYVSKPVGRLELLARVGAVLRFKGEMDRRLENERGLLELTANLAEAYAQLEDLNGNLEQRVQERTAQLELALTELKELDVMKTAFLSNISHELLTPLTAVQGFASRLKHLLAETLLPPLRATQKTGNDPALRKAIDRAEEHIGIVISESQRLTHRIREVLDLAEMEAGDIDWAAEPVDLASVIRRAVEYMAPRAAAKGLGLRVELAPGLPVIQGDEPRLEQALRKLLSNAVKFTDKGEVLCTAERKQRDLLVSVRDTGQGFDPREAKRIFETFRQSGDGITDKPRGAGLGLPLCAHIVARHGGRIWARSAPGKGSVFYFTLPLGQDLR